MNLLLINYEYPPVGAGAANATWHIARELVAQGHVTTVLTARFRELHGWSEEDGIRIYRCQALRSRRDRSSLIEMASFLLGALLAMPRIMRGIKAQGIIVFFSFPSGPLAWWAHRFWKVPYVVSLRGGDVPGAEPGLARMHRLLAPLRRRILRGAKRVIANSQGLKQMSEKVDPIAVSVIPNGVDTTYFSPRNCMTKEAVAPFRFLFVGRLQEQKNLHFTLDQLAALRQRVKRPFLFDIVGDGPLRASLESHANRAGIADVITWHGWLDKNALRQQYQGADCLVNLSLYEGMPNVVLEAMACGLPAIVSRVAGNEALVMDGANGFVCGLDELECVQQALGAIIENTELAARFGETARCSAVGTFSWRRVAGEYAKIFG